MGLRAYFLIHFDGFPLKRLTTTATSDKDSISPRDSISAASFGDGISAESPGYPSWGCSFHSGGIHCFSAKLWSFLDVTFLQGSVVTRVCFCGLGLSKAVCSENAIVSTPSWKSRSKPITCGGLPSSAKPLLQRHSSEVWRSLRSCPS